MSDPFDLARFLQAQEPVWLHVLDELGRGRKQSHWMWFVFPQIKGLGHSAMAERYAIRSRAEAGAYLAHPVLATRLRQATVLVNAVEGRTTDDIFGYPDDLKFRSSMTLFDAVEPDGVFARALEKYFGGKPDQATITLLS